MRASQLGLDRRDALERQGAGDRDDDVAHDPGAGRPQPDRFDPRDPIGADDQGADGFGQPIGRAVDEGVDCRPAQPKACHGDETGDADRGQRVGMRIAGPRRGEAGEHQDRRNEVARIVERVGGERLARRHARHMGQRPPAQHIDRDRKQDRADGECVHVNRRIAAPDAPDRLDRDDDRERGENAGLGQRRHRLELGVAERMIGVGGLVGLAHREQGQRARADVERVMRAFRKKRERAGSKAGRELDDRQNRAGADRGRRRALLECRERLGRTARLRRQSARSHDFGASP